MNDNYQEDELEDYDDYDCDQDCTPEPATRIAVASRGTAAQGLVVITEEDLENTPEGARGLIAKRCEDLHRGLLKALRLDGSPPTVGPISFKPTLKKVVEEAYDEAQRVRITELEGKIKILERHLADPQWVAIFNLLRRAGLDNYGYDVGLFTDQIITAYNNAIMEDL